VNIADANPLVTYVGIAGVGTLEHPHWGANTAQTFVNPLLTLGNYQPGYVEGHDAGGITLGNPDQASTYQLDGRFVAGVVIGERQAAGGQRGSSATANTNLASPTAAPSAGFLNVFGFTNLAILNDPSVLPDSFTVDSRLPKLDATNTQISADTLT